MVEKRLNRSGFTVLEVVVMAAVSVLVVGTLLLGFYGGSKMERAVEKTGLLGAASLVSLQLTEDLVQIGIDPATGKIMDCAPGAVAFYRGSFHPGEAGPIRLNRIGYALRPLRADIQQLVRFQGGKGNPIVGALFREARFDYTPIAGGGVLRLTGQFVDFDALSANATSPASAGSPGLPFLFALPIRVCADLASPGLARALALEISEPL